MRFNAKVVMEALGHLKAPSELEVSPLCLEDKLHLQKGDDLRELYPHGFKILGTITEVHDDYFLLVVDQESIPITYTQANELIENSEWDFVRSYVDEGVIKYQTVQTYLAEQQEKETEEAKEKAQKEFEADLEDPRFRIYVEQNQKLEELTDKREHVQKEYEALADKTKMPSMPITLIENISILSGK